MNSDISAPAARPASGEEQLFYDDSCPLCRHEMSKLQNCQNGDLQLVPISTLPAAEQPRLLSRLHMRTADGRWITGLEANVRAWQHTPYARRAGLLLHPLIRWAAKIGYEVWLLWYRLRSARRVKSP